jgi:hypothetical protein
MSTTIVQSGVYLQFMGLIKTPIILKNYFDQSIADDLFNQLINLQWHDGIRTRYGGITRKAYRIDHGTHLFYYLSQYISSILLQYPMGNVAGFYLNLYENGDMYTPTHKHVGSNQLIISLGATRSLLIGKQNIVCENGDVIIFGEQPHSVPKTTSHVGQRISIATFCFE